MPQHEFNQTFLFRQKLDVVDTDPNNPQNVNSYKTLIDLTNLFGKFDIYSSFYNIEYLLYIQSLDIISDITSLSPAIPGNIYPEDTPEEILAKLKDTELLYPKTGLCIYIKEDGDTIYKLLTTVNLQNYKGLYFTRILNKFANNNGIKLINKTTQLYLKNVDLGYGLLSGSDKVVVTATVITKITVLDNQLLDVGDSGVLTVSTPVLSPGENHSCVGLLSKIAYITNMQSDSVSRVRIYNDANSRTNDTNSNRSAYRVNRVIPGLVCDVSFGSGVNEQGVQVSNLLSTQLRLAIFANQEIPKSPYAAILVTNTDTVAKQINVNIGYTVIQQ